MSRIRRLPRSATLLCCALLLFLGAAPAMGQSPRVEFLETQIERLTRELQDLQRQVYRGETPRAAAAGAPPPAAGTPAPISNTALARIDQRLSAFEEELRGLRGEVEQTRHAMRQVVTRVDKLVADVDFRLTALEQASPSSPPGIAADPNANTPTALSEPPRFERDGRPSPSPEVARALEAERQKQFAPGEASLPQGVQSMGTISVNDLNRQRDAAEALANESATPQQSASGPAAATPSPEPQSQPIRPVAAPSAQQQAALPAARAGTGAVPVSPEVAYDRAYGMLKTARFDQAETELDRFLKTYPDHQLADNARYWLGETHYVRGDFERAALAFADGYRMNPKGGKAADNLLKLARSLGEMGDKANACATLKRLSDEFPAARPAIEQSAAATRAALACQ
jgi:tol-pal system protein YbgF